MHLVRVSQPQHTELAPCTIALVRERTQDRVHRGVRVRREQHALPAPDELADERRDERRLPRPRHAQYECVVLRREHARHRFLLRRVEVRVMLRIRVERRRRIGKEGRAQVDDERAPLCVAVRIKQVREVPAHARHPRRTSRPCRSGI